MAVRGRLLQRMRDIQPAGQLLSHSWRGSVGQELQAGDPCDSRPGDVNRQVNNNRQGVNIR